MKKIKLFNWFTFVLIVFSILVGVNTVVAETNNQESVTIENEYYKVTVEKQSGTITSLVVKANNSELVKEARLASNFRILLPLDDYNANYIEGEKQTAKSVIADENKITVEFLGMSSPHGEFPIDLTYTIVFVDDYVSFKSKLKNNHKQPIAEFWFPRIGGWKQFGDHRESMLAIPNYNTGTSHDVSLFKAYPGARGLGAEAAELSVDYPGFGMSMVMPWWDIYDEKNDVGLYMAYHDPVFRLSTWHTFLMPDRKGYQTDAWLTTEEAAGLPIGLVFSHVRYPYIHSGEILESGEFIIRAHSGDWHHGSQFYRKWFLDRFPFDKSNSWLREKSAWFTSILYQPEDKIVADYKTYDRWTQEAVKYGIDCYELIGWDKGGLERDYPVYQPEEKLGGREGFRDLLKSINSRGGKCLIFNNYNILDQNTDWYKDELYKYRQHDEFGQQRIWMGWGQSTLMARKQLNVRYHVRSSITPEIEKILSDDFLELVKDGAHGFQIDKLCVAARLDFNPLNTMKPDVALYEGLIQAIDRLNQQCTAINPEFRMASEFGYDRLIPYFDVGYRNAAGLDVSTFKYVFPEWTSCMHVSMPGDFRTVNAAVMTGSVIVIEPRSYQSSMADPLYKKISEYIREVERIRKELKKVIFTGEYYDELDAEVFGVIKEASIDKDGTTDIAVPGQMPGTGASAGAVKPASLHYKVHGEKNNGRRAIVVMNDSELPIKYSWKLTHKDVKKAKLYSPFNETKTIEQGDILEIDGNQIHIIVEE